LSSSVCVGRTDGEEVYVDLINKFLDHITGGSNHQNGFC